MTDTFPTTSSLFFELSSEQGEYDLDQLSLQVDSLIDGKGKKNNVDQSSITPPSHFHLHTCTIETTLSPPAPTIEYFDGARVNPEFDGFVSLREKLTQAIEPFDPLKLATPAYDVVQAGSSRWYTSNISNGIDIHLPSSRSKLLHLKTQATVASKEWMPKSAAWDLQNWIHAIIALDPKSNIKGARKGIYKDGKKRFYLLSKLQLCWVPDGEGPQAGAELKLLVTLDVYADMNCVFDPLPGVGPDLMGLILHSLLPTTFTNYHSESEARAAGLRHFYNCLKPAPDLPFSFSATSLQPEEMTSRLLPFQIRTLRLLLQREQAKPLINDAEVKMEQGMRDPSGFWKTFDLGNPGGKIAFRRLTGDLLSLGPSVVSKLDIKGKGRASDETAADEVGNIVLRLPGILDLSGVRGTMLCEEMGLGKTVEAIALVLLNRHPLSIPRRMPLPETIAGPEQPDINPKKQAIPVIDLQNSIPGLEDQEFSAWVKAEQEAFADTRVWDETAKLHVTEVAATLIVTPTPLLKQWVAEMQRHAPSLRVCVYEGWKSLQKSFEKHRAAHAKVRNAKAAEQKRKQGAQMRNQTRKKYAKGKAGERVKVEQESDDEEFEPSGSTSASASASVIPGHQDEEAEEEGALKITQRLFLDYVRAHDVVVTTYADFSQDLKVALPAPSRSRRSTANYALNERPRSPLVMVEWWRVIMDEVQLHGENTDAADMVSLIPRKNSLAVSGTPAKSDIKDLMGSLRFLRVPVLPYDPRLWYRLQQPSMRPAFESLFQSLAIRTTKREVSGEFNLPHQTRIVVPIDLSEIELHYYNDTLERSRDRLRVSGDSRVPRDPEWVLDRILFRAALQNLRQICTHIQVGQMQYGPVGGRGDQRLHLGRSLMTMGQALDKMRNDHSQEYISTSRAQMQAMIEKAQLGLLDEKDDLRYLTALNLYDKVRANATKLLATVREQLHNLGDGDVEGEDGEGSVNMERDPSADKQISQQEKEKRVARQTAHTSIRELSIVLHQAWFFEGDIHHIRKEVDDEINCYAQADQTRKDILAHPLLNANQSIQRLEKLLSGKSAVENVEDLQTTQTKSKGGILSNDTVAQANELLGLLNDNAFLVFEWRQKIISLLSLPIDAAPEEDGNVAKDNTDVVNPEAEYYAEALQAQGEVESYLMAFAAAIADRKEFMLEVRSALAAHDIQVTKQRRTIAAQNATEVKEGADVPDEVQAKTAILMAERQAFRDARQEKGCKRPLKGLLMDLNAIARGDHRPEEVAIAARVAAILKEYINNQSKYVEKLNKELDQFRKIFNHRIVYFAALQEISDLVSAPELKKDLSKELDETSTKITEYEVKLARMAVKGRYLNYLGSKQNEDKDIREDCIICFGSSDDNHAVLLPCGHYFCQSCYKEFRKSAAGRRCPSCRVAIEDREITRIQLNSERMDAPGQVEPTLPITPTKGSGSGKVEEEMIIPQESSEEQERTRRLADLDKLKMMEVEKRREVMTIDMLGEYGSKINFLVKHLLYYKAVDPTARHVIFSNWSDSLNIVMQALKTNDITFTSFDQGRKQKDVVDKFLNDQSISVFLLHAERESSGLTLTTCRVVHLLEPVLRHSFELQAIGRVDRLGQDKETTVYCYATMETVESRILAQGVRTGTSIYLDDEQADNLVADMPNVASAAHKGGDVSGDGSEEELLGLIL